MQSLDLLMDIFLQNNCLEHMFQVMSYHPKYLECFMRIQQYLMYGDGPLPFSYRHYIAIMVGARFLTNDFLFLAARLVAYLPAPIHAVAPPAYTVLT